MFERLEAILERYEKINEMMADPAIVTDIKKLTELSKEQRQVQRAIISPFEKNLLFACQLLGLNWQYDNKPNNYIDFTRAKIIFS